MLLEVTLPFLYKEESIVGQLSSLTFQSQRKFLAKAGVISSKPRVALRNKNISFKLFHRMFYILTVKMRSTGVNSAGFHPEDKGGNIFVVKV